MSEKLRDQNKDFLLWIQNSFNPKKISEKLKKPYLLDESVFFEELRKQKVNLSTRPKEFKALRDEWLGLKEIYESIQKTDREIDQIVYELYGLTEEEIGIVEKSISD